MCDFFWQSLTSLASSTITGAHSRKASIMSSNVMRDVRFHPWPCTSESMRFLVCVGKSAFIKILISLMFKSPLCDTRCRVVHSHSECDWGTCARKSGCAMEGVCLTLSRSKWTKARFSASIEDLFCAPPSDSSCASTTSRRDMCNLVSQMMYMPGQSAQGRGGWG